MTINLIEDKASIPSVYKKGYIGFGIHTCCLDGKLTKKYKVWYDMLMRCYSKKYQNKHPSYIGCTVDDKWLNYQVFANWFENNYVEGYELDKDILFKGNKLYSESTCCFVPHSINLLLVNCVSRFGNLPIGVKLTPSNKYQVNLNIKGIRTYLGTFVTIEEAFDIYLKAKKKEVTRQANLYQKTLSINCYTALLKYDIKITD